MPMEWSKLLNPNRVRLSTIVGDHREQFERDFDRAIFSTPVKRLQDKAQVFPLEPHDAVRTRLTHSLEVSSVSRGLAIAVGKWLVDEGHIEASQVRSVEAIAATAGLLHDLGNPPFGHSGEDAIREWFVRTFAGSGGGSDVLEGREQLIQDFLKFEGNAQSLRLVSKLQILADYYGLNLTYGTLSTMCKYVAASHEVDTKGADCARKKPGFFASENDLVDDIRTQTGTGANRNPITYLVEAADDIVYSAADAEDAVKKGEFSWRELEDMLRHPDHDSIEAALSLKDKILRSDRTGDELPELESDVHAAAFRTAAIGELVRSAVQAFKDRYGEIMAGAFTGDLVSTCKSSSLILRLKKIGKDHVYCTPSNLKLEVMGRRVICDLMDILWEGVRALPINGRPSPTTFAGKIGALLSENYRRVFRHWCNEDTELPEMYFRFQLLTDYVCGMTDSFAKRLHADLFNG